MTRNMSYHEKTIFNTQLKLKSIMEELPDFCQHFFIGIEHSTEPGTQLRYAYDLKLFFKYVLKQHPEYKTVKNINVNSLDELSVFEIEQFLSYIKSYIDDKGIPRHNGRAGIKSKLAAIRSLYNYCFKHGLISKNTSQLVDIPVIEEKNIIRLNPDQVDKVLKNIDTGLLLKGRQSLWNSLYRVRDYAVVSLLLGTGIRVSECAGIDLKDVSFTNCSVQIIRKGGNEDRVYFSDEVKQALCKYYNERITIQTKDPYEQAFFLSKCKTRLSVRSIQELVHKYSKGIKEVTPHKLRATFGTNLYIATKDIYLVADSLGHSNVETTRRHYADLPDQEKRNARNILHLRKK